jgi:hypothetical protein
MPSEREVTSNSKAKCGKTADGFKPFDEILLPDPRQHGFGVLAQTGQFRSQALEDFHKALSQIELHSNVPRDVQVAFDTARNLYLYSWFVYRFQTSADFQAYAALELALRTRINPQGDKESRKFLGLTACLKHALKNKWFADRKVRRYQRLLKATQEHAASYSGVLEFGDPLKLPPDAWVQRLEKSLPTLRNPLAHGRPLLMGGTLGTLEICCDLINQLFPAPEPD